MEVRRNEGKSEGIKPLNVELNPICHLLALLESHDMLHVSKIRVKVTKEKGRNERKKKEKNKRRKKRGTEKGIRQ